MATVEECEQAFHALADRLAAVDPAQRKHTSLDRSLSCTLTDLDTAFGARLHNGELNDIEQVEVAQAREAQVKLRMTGDDLIALTDGKLNFAQAWSKGRVKIDASVFDLVKLRSIF